LPDIFFEWRILLASAPGNQRGDEQHYTTECQQREKPIFHNALLKRVSNNDPGYRKGLL
jgi:hypothetical protein